MALEIWTIKRLLEWISEYFTGNNVDSPRLSAELLLCHILKLERIQLYTLYDRVVQAEQLTALRALVKRGAAHEPIAYLVGRCEFYSLPLKVTPDCLIPRPETEHLVEKAILFLRQRTAPKTVLDLCTGSGCIAAAMAKNTTDVQVTATDISDRALAVATENITRHKLQEKVSLLCGDLFAPLAQAAPFDLIVSNPPYISEPEYEKLEDNVKKYEPKLALYAGIEGLDVYKRILADVDRFLKPDGALMMEIGYAQGPAIRDMLTASGLFKDVAIEKDFAGCDRIAIAKK